MANKLSIDQVADLAYAVGLRGNALAVAIAIAQAESTLDAEARGDTTIQTAKWGPSIGLWQVRSLKADRGTGKERDELALYSPSHNARSMYSISSGGTKWTPWSVYTTKKAEHSYRRFMYAAQSAADRREQSGGSGSISGGGAPGGSSDPTAGAVAAPTPVDLGTSVDIVAGLSPMSLNYSPPRQVADLRIERNGKRVAEDVVDYVVSGRVELTTGEASELALTVHNPGRRFLGGNADVAKGSRLTWSGIDMRIVATELGQGPGAPSADITARSEAVYQLKRDNLEVGIDLEAKRSSPTEWLLKQMNARVGPTRFVAQGSPRRADIAPTETNGKTETAWQMATRMAGELGYWLFEAAGVVYFGQPSWIMRNTVELRVAGTPGAWGDERLDALEVPTIRESLDSDTGADMTVLLPRWRGEQARPGHKLVLQGIDGVPRLWIVTRVSWPIDGGRAPVTVDASEPIDPPPKDTADVAAATPTGQADPATAAGGGAPVVQAGTGSALEFVDLCLSQAGDRYVFGAEASASNPNPDAFDCSELVEWACARIGIKIVDGAVNQWRACRRVTIAEAARTRGALLFAGDGTGSGRDAIYHVAISLGDGKRTIEARGRAYGVNSFDIGNRFQFAGLIPGMKYG